MNADVHAAAEAAFGGQVEFAIVTMAAIAVGLVCWRAFLARLQDRGVLQDMLRPRPSSRDIEASVDRLIARSAGPATLGAVKSLEDPASGPRDRGRFGLDGVLGRAALPSRNGF